MYPQPLHLRNFPRGKEKDVDPRATWSQSGVGKCDGGTFKKWKRKRQRNPYFIGIDKPKVLVLAVHSIASDVDINTYCWLR